MGSGADTLTALVLTWNDSMLTERCVSSLVAQMAPQQVVIIDNGSEPSVAAELEGIAQRAGVCLHTNADNLGYAGGMNSGLPLVRTPHVLLSNNDVTYSETAVADLSAALDDTSVRLVQPSVITEDGRTVMTGGRFPTLGRVLARALLLDLAVERWRLETADQDSMDWYGGPALAARTSDVRAIGGLRSPAGFYGEDLALSWDLRRRGPRIATLTTCHVRHEAESTASQRWSSEERAAMKRAVWWRAARDCAPIGFRTIAMALTWLRVNLAAMLR